MKKLLALFVLIACITFTMVSCGGGEKKDDQKTEEEKSDEYEIAEPKKDSNDDLIKQGQALVDASDCKTCHHATNKLVGPAHAEVAKKYEFTPANVTLIADKIIKGGAGNWGQIPMSPHPDISKADAEKMAMYVLSLDGEKLK